MTPPDGWDDAETDDAHLDEGGELDGVHDYGGPEIHDDEVDGFGALDSPATQPPEDEEQIPVVQAVNPPGTVAITAYLNGAVAQVDLDPKVTTLTEPQLAEEIRVVAGVAAKKATAVVHVGVVNMLVEQGMDFTEAKDFVETNMPFATPRQAGEAELELIARHAHTEH
ncbi:hypothetical protein ACWDTP_33350 [Mycobacterium sp. NPDC003449]